MKTNLKLSKELEEKKAWIEKTHPLRDINSLCKFFNMSAITFLDLKKQFPKMPCEQTPEGFFCTDTIEMLRFWIAYTRVYNPYEPYEYTPWYEHHPVFEPFMKDIPPIDSYR